MKEIAIFIITRCTNGLIYKCLKSLTEQTSIDNCSVNVCYTGDSETEKANLENYLKKYFANSLLVQDTYNFAKNNNQLSRQTKSGYILFLNDDVELVRRDTLDYMHSIAKLPTIGTVGIKLLFPNTFKIQHGGVFALMKDDGQFVGVSHLFLNKDVNADNSDRYVIGNTAACLMMKRKLFEKIYFNENYQKCFEDVELNIECILKDYTNVCLNSISAIHHESATRKQAVCKEDVDRIKSLFETNFENIKKWCFLLDKNNKLRND